jgi:hypothetical protein
VHEHHEIAGFGSARRRSATDIEAHETRHSRHREGLLGAHAKRKTDRIIDPHGKSAP